VPRVTSKGQVTLPKKIRDALGIGPGTEVEFELAHDRAVLRKRVPIEALDRWQGHLRGQLPADSVDELMEALRGERAPEGGSAP
jgi:AbrB family looped-hinge helix DNA binding protein